MKNILFTMSIVFFLQVIAWGQISMQPGIPVTGLIQKNQLWTILLVNNSGTAYNAKVDMVLTDRATGMEIMTATTIQFVLATGSKQLNADILNPIQYNYLGTSFDSRMQGFLSIGNYTACYSLSAVGIKEAVLAEECVSFDVEPLSPPSLIFPADSSDLEQAPLQFSWIPPSPQGMFNNLRYDVLITAINEGQKASEAIEENIPFYNDGNQLSANMLYPGSATAFEKDKWYAWQVVAKDENSYAAKSEVWTFRVKPSVIISIIEQSPFIKMRKNNPEKGIAPNGILKIAYRNETTDSVTNIRVTDLDQRDKGREFRVVLKPGENLIQYNLKKLMSIKEGKIYEAEIRNSRNERWVIQFEYRNYEEQKPKN